MRFRSALRTALTAARTNILPGALLQALMLVFLSAYIAHEGTRQFLSEVARVKSEAGFLFAFVSYIVAAALLPELLRVAFFQGGRIQRRNVWLFLTAAPFWGAMGIVVDAFYRFQGQLFGSHVDAVTIVCKVLVDQFLFSPLIGVPSVTAWFFWRDSGFRRSAGKQIFCTSFLWDRIFPIQVAGWLIWIPGVTLVYFMPPLLQIPVAVLIQCFWVMILTTLGERFDRKSPLAP